MLYVKLVNFRAPEEEIQSWKTAAAEARVSFAAFARRALNTAVGSQPLAQIPPPVEEPTAPRIKIEDCVVYKPAPPKKGKCEHRLPSGSFCKSCGKTKE